MKVLLLSNRANRLWHTLERAGDTFWATMDSPEEWTVTPDFIVSYGYRHIIKEPYLTQYKDRLINIHISMLPWNRGADPNFWSWFDATPKGVSIHLVDDGIDTGDIIVQKEVKLWERGQTLASSYDVLHLNAEALFDAEWGDIRNGTIWPEEQELGTYHKSTDKNLWMSKLPLGWKTPVEDVIRMGEQYRDSTSSGVPGGGGAGLA